MVVTLDSLEFLETEEITVEPNSYLQTKDNFSVEKLENFTQIKNSNFFSNTSSYVKVFL